MGGRNTTTSDRQLRVTDLTGGTSYNYFVLAVNGAGDGVPAYSMADTQAGGERGMVRSWDERERGGECVSIVTERKRQN